MPFIDRDSSGNICGVYNMAQRDGQEFVADASPELIAYYERKTPDLGRLVTKAVIALLHNDQAELARLRNLLRKS